jgi:hypothetical protein
VTVAVVAGALANKPLNGGEAWVRLSWVLGLRRLGLDVFFVEVLAPEADAEAGTRYFREVVEGFGLASASGLLRAGESIWGLSRPEIVEVAEAADLLVNISGNLRCPDVLRGIPRRAYVDLDPGFTQHWHAAGQDLGLEEHTIHFTVGEHIGTPSCPIPTGDIHWLPTRQPVLLDEWPASDMGEPGRFTTVASWRGSLGRVEWQGRSFGVKAHEFRKFLRLPELAPGAFEIALDIHPGDERDRSLLEGHGWTLTDPTLLARDPDSFRRYVNGSWAEFSVAQSIYVETRCGWFSDRTTRYLAAGKPALVQGTGFSDHLPVGEGLMAFESLDEAVAGAESIAADYGKHSRAARAIADEYFDSDKVLTRFLDQVGVAR